MLILLEYLHFRDNDLWLISDDGRNTLYGLVKDKEDNDSGNSARSGIKQIFLVLELINTQVKQGKRKSSQAGTFQEYN